MITIEQITKLSAEQKDLLLLHLLNKNEMNSKVRQIKSEATYQKPVAGYNPALRKFLQDEVREVIQPRAEETTYSIDGAPVWDVWFHIQTSEGDMEQVIEQESWTEKQAVFLARMHQLWPAMCDMVKAKQIGPKWKIVDAVATKR